MRILFVDDEQRILSGLKRMLRDMRNEWDMEFCLGSEEGLEAVRRDAFDVVVSDMKMPHMDGATFLTEVKRLRPESVRIILSGESDARAIFQSMGVTHRYLDKPCDPQVLKTTIKLARLGARALVDDEALASALTRIDRLPSLPAIYQRVVSELNDPESTAERVGALIEQEVAMSAKVLQVVNSAAFGFPNGIERVSKAVALLGVDRVKQLVLAAGLFEELRERAGVAELNQIWHRALRTLELSTRFLDTLKGSGEAFDIVCSSAMLHECGRLVLVADFAERHRRTVKRSIVEGVPLERAEQDEFGFPHGRIGAFVLSLWGLPQHIVETVAHHQAPSKAAVEPQDAIALAVVHAAAALADGAADPALDTTFLERRGLADRLGQWRAIAVALDEETQ